MFILHLVEKLIRFIILAIVIIALVCFVAFNIADESNPINQNYRKYFLVNSLTKQAFFLNNAGDDRYVYLDESKPTILIEVDYQQNLEPSIELETWLVEAVKDLTNKRTLVQSAHESEIPDLKSFTEQQIIDVIEVSRNYTPEANQNYLQILYLSKSFEQPDLIGKAIGKDTIVIFKDKIDETSTDFATTNKLERASIEQQLATQLGIQLIDRPRCFMSREINILNTTEFDLDNVPTNHCSESLVELDDIKQIGNKYTFDLIN